MSDPRFIFVCLLFTMAAIRCCTGYDYLTAPQESPCTSPTGNDFGVAFIDDLSGDDGNLQLHITNPGETNATVKVMTLYVPDTSQEYLNIEGTIEPLKTSVFSLPKSLRVLATGFEKKMVTVHSDVNVHVLAVQNGTAKPSSFVVYPWNSANIHTTVVTGDVDNSGRGKAVVVIIPRSTSVRWISVGVSERAVIEYGNKVYRGANAYYAGDLPYDGETIHFEVSGGQFIVLSSDTDISGSYVHSEQGLIVFAGNTGSGSLSSRYPHRQQQMLTDSASGFYFITPSFPEPSTESVFKAIVTLPDTVVAVKTFEGEAVHYVPDLQPVYIRIVNPANSILRVNSTRRIKLFQTEMDVGGSSSMGTLRPVPALEHFTSDVAFTTPFEGNNDVIVYAIKDTSDAVMLDGEAVLEGDWILMNGTRMWYTKVRVTKGSHRLQSNKGSALLLAHGIFRTNGITTAIETGHIICANKYVWREPTNDFSYYIRVTAKGPQLPDPSRLMVLETFSGPVVMCLQRCFYHILCGAVIDLGMDSEGNMSCQMFESNIVYYSTDYPVYARFRP